MMPRRVVEHRAPSLWARHTDVDPSSDCHGIARMHLTRSPLRGFEFLVVIRCAGCDLGGGFTPVEVRGVVPEEAQHPEYYDGDQDDDPDDCNDIQPWGE